MRNIPTEMIIDSVDAGVGAVIDLFELDLTPLGGEVIRFHSGANGYYGPVIWKGVAYNSYPIEATGFEKRRRLFAPSNGCSQHRRTHYGDE